MDPVVINHRVWEARHVQFSDMWYMATTQQLFNAAAVWLREHEHEIDEVLAITRTDIGLDLFYMPKKE